MKNLTRFLVAVACAVAAVELQADPSAPVQPCTSSPSARHFVLKPIPSSAVHHQQAPRRRLDFGTSENWSGYAVPLEGSGVASTFSYVAGTWEVPTVGAGTQSGVAYAATWVGLDGYENDTVEQTGTEQEWTGSAQANYAWFEMYPGGSYEIEEVVNGRDVAAPVDAGDIITASVAYVGTTTVSVGRGRTETEYVFQLAITNTSATHGWYYVIPTSYTTTTTAARASAEWILEAPASNEILPLADFGSPTTLFTDCYATSTAGTAAYIGTDEPINFWPADPLTMEDPEGGESTPSGLTADSIGDGFTATWSALAPTRGGSNR